MPEITLNKIEQLVSINLALDRTNNARSKGIFNAKMGNQPDWVTDLNGMGAEIAAARYFGVYPDTDIGTILPTYDLRSKKGSRIDVKTTKYPDGKLLATLKKNVDDCDIYVLVTGEFPVYKIVGYAEAKDLINESTIKDLGHGKGYVLDQSQLKMLP